MIEIENGMHDPQVELATCLAQLLGTAVELKFLAHGYHWNVKGIEFAQLHEFFGEIYEDIDGSIDTYAESLRRLSVNAPYFLDDFKELSILDEQVRIDGDAQQMLHSLYFCNMEFINLLRKAFDCTQVCSEQGIANFIAERIDMHAKWDWQISASLNLDAGL